MATTAVRVEAEVRELGVAGHAGWLRPLRYWHLLSLDAPTVAAAWMLVFSRGVRGRAVEAVALFLAVWLLYVADRLLDARRADERLEARHRFHARHVRWFAAAWVAVAVVLVMVLPFVAGPVRNGWFWLAVPLGGYALLVHAAGERRVPKEWMVAGMFALGTVLPGAVSLGWSARVVVGAGLFAVVCLLNCAAIARWEHGGGCGLPRWSGAQFRAVCFAVAGVALVLAVWLRLGVAVPCGLSALLLCGLDAGRRRVDAVALRALADAALLTPVLLLVLVR